MLIVPELERIYILPPRTGSDSLRYAMTQRFRGAFLLYRHAEASEVPAAYGAWTQIVLVRHPVARMWSLFKYLHIIGDGLNVRPELQPHVALLRRSVEGETFAHWLCNANVPLTPLDAPPLWHQRARIPENVRSQAEYGVARASLLPLSNLDRHFKELGVSRTHINRSDGSPSLPTLGWRERQHFEKYMQWDFNLNLKPL